MHVINNVTKVHVISNLYSASIPRINLQTFPRRQQHQQQQQQQPIKWPLSRMTLVSG